MKALPSADLKCLCSCKFVTRYQFVVSMATILNLVVSLQVRGGERDQWAGDMCRPGDGDEASERM